MYGRLRIFWFCASFLLLTAFAAALSSPIQCALFGRRPIHVFPDQFEANEWYKPSRPARKRPYQRELWREGIGQRLRRFLHETKGALR